MHIARYADPADGQARLGAVVDGRIAPVRGVAGIAELLTLDVARARDLVADTDSAVSRAVGEVRLLPPADGLVEVWAAGVTYERSRSARVEETGYEDVYTRVYGAARPELFFKSPAWRVVTGGEPVGVRPDARVTVPEPELAVLVTAKAEILGYTVCNDMSSRDIEGENPLYLPQAKSYAGSCGLAALVRPAWEVPDPAALGIRLEVRRAGESAFTGATSTSRMRRSIGDLVEYLMLAQDFPAGAVLATGTGIVPDLDFTLLPGDRVDIDVDEVGSLSNPVESVTRPFHQPAGLIRRAANRSR